MFNEFLALFRYMADGNVRFFDIHAPLQPTASTRIRMTICARTQPALSARIRLTTTRQEVSTVCVSSSTSGIDSNIPPPVPVR